MMPSLAAKCRKAVARGAASSTSRQRLPFLQHSPAAFFNLGLAYPNPRVPVSPLAVSRFSQCRTISNNSNNFEDGRRDGSYVVSVGLPGSQDQMQVKELKTTVGRAVLAGHELVVLESKVCFSMSVAAPCSGIVQEVLKNEGEAYLPGDALLKILVTDSVAKDECNAHQRRDKDSDWLALSYPQGGDTPLEQPVQLHFGSYVELLPQLVGSASAVITAHFVVKPPLPPGLSINAATGAISGVPTTITPVRTYTVTAAPLQRAHCDASEFGAHSKSGEALCTSTQVSLAVAAGKIHTAVGSRKAGNTTTTLLPGLQQKLRDPRSLCAHRGKLYIGQYASIAEMDLQTGQVKLLLGVPGILGNGCLEKMFLTAGTITGMAVYEEELYFASCEAVRKVGLPGSRAPGLMSLVAGTGKSGFSGDGGPATSAELNSPWGLAILDGGKLLIADRDNHCIRAVDLETGVITTVAGTPISSGLAGDGGPALQAKLSKPRGLLVLGQVVYVADSCNHCIRSIDFQQNPPRVATFAGGGTKSIDGASGGDWQLSYPAGLSLGMDGKMYTTSCWNGSTHTVVAMDLQQPHHPTSFVAGTGVKDNGADFIPATSSALHDPIAVAAVGEDAVYIAEKHCIRRVAVSGAFEELMGGNEAAAMQPAELMDKMQFLGSWSTLKSHAAIASPFCLPAGSAFFSPALPQDSSDFRFSLALSGLSFPPCVLGVASRDSIVWLAEGLHADGGFTAADFEGVGMMLSPVSVRSKRLAIVPYAAGMAPTQASQATTEVMKLFLRDKITLTGSVRRKELGDGSYEYTLKDVLLNGMPAAMPSFSSITTPHVGADVAMHVFIAVVEPSSNQLQIIVQNPPLLERSSSS